VGQTYTWQSATSVNGTYSNISSGLAFPATEILPATTTYYRAAVTCLGNTMYSSPIRVIIHTKLPGGTYTINSTQPTGSINFNSFSDAALAMQCGVTGPVVFNVAPNTGPYNEQVILPAINTSPTQTVTFKCNGDTLTFAATNNDERAVIKLNGTDYVTIDSLHIKVLGASFGYGIQMMGDADHNTIKQCSITLGTDVKTTGFAGIVINNSINNAVDISKAAFSDSNTIANNTITGGYYGITCTSRAFAPPSYVPLGNTFTGNKIMDTYGYGIYLEGVAKSLVDSNDISQPTRTGFANFSGIYVKQSNSVVVSPHGMQISRNKVHDLLNNGVVATLETHGIHFETVAGMSAFPNIVCNNLMYHFGGVGGQYGIYSKSSNYLKVYHNTVSLDDSIGTNSSGIITCGFGLLGNISVGSEFKNNCITIKRGGFGTRTGIFISGNDSALRSDYNNYLINASKGISNTGSMGGKTYSKLSDWLAVRKDSNSVSIDPLYIYPHGGDFTPGSIPFENKGAFVGIPADINDSIRSTTKPDMGAYEFIICRPLGTPVLTIDSAGVNVIRFAWAPVTNATSYLVSRNGTYWDPPSSGPKGTTHTITGLYGSDTTTLIVQAIGTRWDCPPAYSQRVKAQTLSDQVFIPNTFTPNGNQTNDVFKVYSNMIKTMRLMVFNQWGMKVFETTDATTGWDGTYQGKPQPVGVYIYVASIQLTDNRNITKKGSFNLVR
jgi:gliding motility-associated-like protein